MKLTKVTAHVGLGDNLMAPYVVKYQVSRRSAATGRAAAPAETIGVLHVVEMGVGILPKGRKAN